MRKHTGHKEKMGKRKSYALDKQIKYSKYENPNFNDPKTLKARKWFKGDFTEV